MAQIRISELDDVPTTTVDPDYEIPASADNETRRLGILQILTSLKRADVSPEKVTVVNDDGLFGVDSVSGALRLWKWSTLNAAFAIADSAVTYAKLAAAAIADAAALRAGTVDKLVNAETVHNAMAWVSLAAASSPPINHAAGFNRFITLAQNTTFPAPSNTKPGMPLNIDITPGAFTSSWNAVFKFGVNGAPSITARRIVHFMCRDATNYIFLGVSDPS